jgi:DNA polymerase-3 subunit gamma/tau
VASTTAPASNASVATARQASEPRAASDDDYIPASYDPDGDPYAGMGNDPYAGADPAPTAPQSDPAPGRRSGETAPPRPSAAAGTDPAAPAPAAASAPAATPAHVPAAAAAGADVPDDAPDRAGAKRAAPAFTRYGEAVVREVLGARFVEERPLPPRAP